MQYMFHSPPKRWSKIRRFEQRSFAGDLLIKHYCSCFKYYMKHTEHGLSSFHARISNQQFLQPITLPVLFFSFRLGRKIPLIKFFLLCNAVNHSLGVSALKHLDVTNDALQKDTSSFVKRK
jgi:hypothetical protein